jgi:uroporphyrinogen decarboxylase
MAAPLAGYAGLRLVGRSAREALGDAGLQLECVRALEKRLGPDISFPLMDLTVEAQALGLEVEFKEKKRPKLADQALPSMGSLYQKGIPDPEKSSRMPVFLEVAEGTGKRDGSLSAAFVTGPLTLLAQLMGAEALMQKVMGGEGLETEMSFATSVIGEYAAALAARVDMVWVVDPVPGALSEGEFSAVYRPYVSVLSGIIRGAGACGVLHICSQVSHLLEQMAFCGFEGLSFDSAIDLPKQAEKLPKNLVMIGNIDGHRVLQRGSVDDVRWEVRRLLRHTSKARNLIVSTACDIPVDVPIRNLETMIAEVRAWKPRT